MIKPKIVFMLGYPRSGSTVFGELINQSEHFLHVGEMERLWFPRNVKASLYPQKGCSCGKKLCDCDFWLPYLKRVAEKVKLISANRGVELNNKILCTYKEDFIQKGKIHGVESKIYTEVIYELCKNLQEGEHKIILDSSKELWYAKYLESTGLFDLFYIHLIRDVKGVVYSRQKKLKFKDQYSGKVSLDYKYLIHDTLRWKHINSKTRVFLKNKPSIEISYEKMVEYPREALDKLGLMMNLKMNAENIVNSDNEFYIENNHLVHGNRFRNKRGTIKLERDNRYIEEMKNYDLRLINFLSWFTYNENN